MLWDIAIASALAFIMLGTGYLGIRVTIYPVQSDRSRMQHKITFWGLGVLAVILIAVQTIRNAKTQADLHDRLAQIEKNTKTPPTVNVNVPQSPPVQVVIPQQQREEITNRQLHDAALDLARRMRLFQNETNDQQERILRRNRDELDKVRSDQEAFNKLWSEQGTQLASWRTRMVASFGPLRSEAQNMRVQLLGRLPPQQEESVVRMVLDDNALAGANPIYTVADYFERLAKSLPLK